MSQLNQVMTASRMNCLEVCPRQHFLRYEVGLQKDAVGHALRFGSAWARAMEARWNGAGFLEALQSAILDCDLDLFSCETVAALLGAYYTVYGPSEREGKMQPEAQLPFYKIEGTDFTAGGKMDSLGILHARGEALIEAKTTRCRLDDSSDYWLRLSFNTQVLHYLTEARRMGHDPKVAFYDVTRKPQTKPKEVEDVDEHGNKIVVDSWGARVFKMVGKAPNKLQVPRQSPDKAKGYTLKTHKETPEEFGNRLFSDALSRPEFYFRRKEIPIQDRQMDKFLRKRLELCNLIDHYRDREGCIETFDSNGNSIITRNLEHGIRDEEAWPKFVREQNCQYCNFKSFCLQDHEIDLAHPPAGFSIQPFNPELEQVYDEDASEETAATN